jgi:hypothetical protein
MRRFRPAASPDVVVLLRRGPAIRTREEPSPTGSGVAATPGGGGPVGLRGIVRPNRSYQLLGEADGHGEVLHPLTVRRHWPTVIVQSHDG